VFLKACPGSGKTEMVGLKAAYEMSKWKKTPGGIAVLTFTNNAAEVIEKRISQFGSVVKIGFPHFIGTIDSWLHGYIAHPFAHLVTDYEGKNGDGSIRVIDNQSKADFLNAFKTKYVLAETGNPAANEYYLDIESGKYIFSSLSEIDSKRKKQILEDWQVRDLEETKVRFKTAGFSTYQDVEQICYELLSKKPKIAQLLSLRFPFIIVDECQDLSWIQMQLLDKMRSNGTALHLVGDLNQAIYEFKRVAPEKVKKYTQEHGFIIQFLSNNYRNCQKIADLCVALVGNKDNIKSLYEGELLENPCVCMQFEKDAIMKLPLRFSDYLDRVGINKKNSAIVIRNRENIYRIWPEANGRNRKYQYRLALAIYFWKTGDRQTIGDAIKFFGSFVSEKFFSNEAANSREYFRPESMDSAVIWRLFLAEALSECCQDDLLCNLRQTWKTWAQAVRDRLHKHLEKSKNTFGAILSEYEFPPLATRNNSSPIFIAPSAMSSSQVLESMQLDYFNQVPMRITTIHNVKGETMDALMLVSSRDKRGTKDGYWTQWLDDTASEAARLAYVASSRPRKLIIWAIPIDHTGEKERLRKMGFHIQPADPIAAPNSPQRTLDSF